MIPGLFAGLRQLLMRSGTPQEPQKRLPGVYAAPQAGQFASSFVISAIDVRLTGAAAAGAGSGRARRLCLSRKVMPPARTSRPARLR